jgi:hypothetical protein
MLRDRVRGILQERTKNDHSNPNTLKKLMIEYEDADQNSIPAG